MAANETNQAPLRAKRDLPPVFPRVGNPAARSRLARSGLTCHLFLLFVLTSLWTTSGFAQIPPVVVPSGSVEVGVWDPDIGQPSGDTWVNGNAKGYAEGQTAAMLARILGANTTDTWTVGVCIQIRDDVGGIEYAFSRFGPWDESVLPGCLPTAGGACDGSDITPVPDYSNPLWDRDHPIVWGYNLNIAAVAGPFQGLTTAASCDDDYQLYQVVFDPPADNEIGWLVWGGRLAKPGDPLPTAWQPPPTVPDGQSAGDVNGTFQSRLGGANLGQKTINYNGSDISFASVLSFGPSVDPAGRVVLTWETDMELGTVGFHLDRLLDPATGSYERLTDALVPAAPYAPHGSTYRYVDETAWPGETHTYRLVEEEASGNERVYGPYVVDIPPFELEAPPPAKAPGGLAGLSIRESLAPRAAEAPSTFSTSRRVGGVDEVGDFMISRFEREERGPSDADRIRFEAASAFPVDREEGAQASPASRSAKGISAASHRTSTVDLQAAAATQQTPAAAKVLVREAGIHTLSAKALAATFSVPERQIKRWIRKQQLALSCQSGPVATTTASRYEALVFYRAAMDNAFTNEEVCWLALGEAKSMGNENGRRPRALPGGAFTDLVAVERDEYPIIANVPLPVGLDYRIMTADDDLWYWDSLYGSDGLSADFEVRSDGSTGSGGAQLTVTLLGFSGDLHKVGVSINAHALDDPLEWYGNTTFEKTLTFDGSYLNDGVNTVTLTNSNGTKVHVSGFELSYRRRYQAVDDALVVTGDENPVITIDDFSNPNIGVYNITEPDEPKRVTRTRVEQHDAGYRVSFKPSGAKSRYLALTDVAVIDVEANALRSAKDTSYLRNADAEIVIIAPAPTNEAVGGSLYAEAEQVLTLVKDLGYGSDNVLLTSLEDVQDEFAGGMRTPYAVRDFLAYAYKNWETLPRYAVLVGGGSYDYKGLLGPDGQQNTGDEGTILNPIPPLMVQNPTGGWFACDLMCLGDVDEDGEIDIAVGRIPVVLPDELRGYICQKLRPFLGLSECEDAVEGSVLADSGTDNTAWTTRAVLASDYTNDYDYSVDSDPLGDIACQSGYIDTVVKVAKSASVEALSEFKEEIDRGALLANYIGHGGPTNLMGVSWDGTASTNGLRLPLFTAFTCAVGRYEMPGRTSLVENLLLNLNGGVHTAFAPSGLSDNDEAVKIANALFESVFEDGESVVGDIAVQALQRYLDSDNAAPYMAYIYNLYGFPLTTIPLTSTTSSCDGVE